MLEIFVYVLRIPLQMSILRLTDFFHLLVPSVDLRVPPPCQFPTGMTPPQSTAASSTPPANPVKAIPITPVKPPAGSTFSAATTTSALPMALVKGVTDPPTVQVL